MSDIYDATVCALGEGPLWHPERNQLFWFDILNATLFSRAGDQLLSWQFDEMVSAAGWVDHDTLVIASETALRRFDIRTGDTEYLCGLEADNPDNRSNDGRADPQGGFWIGTMGKSAEKHAGAIYRYFNGELRRLYSRITISNSICFAPDGRSAYYADTSNHKIMRQSLDDEGWPDGKPELFIDMTSEQLRPDGAVVDTDGTLWIALSGGGRVVRYDSRGNFMSEIAFDAPKTTCPAFIGTDRTTLVCTSAAENMTESQIAACPQSGMTFYAQTTATGQAEHRVLL